MDNLPILHDIKLSGEEKTYLRKATKYGIQSTEVLHVIVLQRISNYLQMNLIGAMEQPNFKVLRLTTEDIQKSYTIVKGALRNPIVIIPGDSNANNTKE